MFLSCCFVMIFWYPLMNSTLGNMPSPPFDCSFVVVMGVLLLHRRFTRPPPSVKYVDEASPGVISVFTLGNPIPPPLGTVAPLLSFCPTRNLHPWTLSSLPPASDRLCWSGFRVTSPRTCLPVDTIPLLIVRGSDGAGGDFGEASASVAAGGGCV